MSACHAARPDPRTGLVHGMSWSMHSEVMTPGQNMMANAGPNVLPGQVQDAGFA
jgi:hypothetical protein